MRIISGKYKGRYIPVRKKFNARPTTDFAKENLFNILNNNFEFSSIKVLDLFSGTGSISYEFTSRGCEDVTLVEKDYKSFKFIKETISALKFDSIRAIRADVFKFLQNNNEMFDIIFADPPYELDKLSEIPKDIFHSNSLNNNGWLILEHGKKHQFNDNQHLIDIRIYGSVHFSFFKKKY